MLFDVEICRHSLLLTHFLLVYFRTLVTVKQTSYRSSYIFRAAHRLYWNKSSYWKQLLFCKILFFRTSTCLEELLLFNNYLLVTNTISDQLPLEDKNVSSTATVTFRRSYFFRISNCSKHILFRSRRFFRTGPISEEKLF